MKVSIDLTELVSIIYMVSQQLIIQCDVCSVLFRPELHDTGLLFVSDWLALSNTKVVQFCFIYAIPGSLIKISTFWIAIFSFRISPLLAEQAWDVYLIIRLLLLKYIIALKLNKTWFNWSIHVHANSTTKQRSNLVKILASILNVNTS